MTHSSFSILPQKLRDMTAPRPNKSVVPPVEPPPAAIAKPIAAPHPSRLSPWLVRLAYPFSHRLVLPTYFRHLEVTGQDNLPRQGAVILAPTHRSRWDSFVVPYAAGYPVTGRHLRFMVSADEMIGLQGWFIRRLGGFPVNTQRPAIATLRHGVELLQQGEVMVIFPEGNIFRDRQVQPCKLGLARLAVQAATQRPAPDIHVVPMAIRYSDPQVPWRSRVSVKIGAPLPVLPYLTHKPKQAAQQLTTDLHQQLSALSQQFPF